MPKIERSKNYLKKLIAESVEELKDEGELNEFLGLGSHKNPKWTGPKTKGQSKGRPGGDDVDTRSQEADSELRKLVGKKGERIADLATADARQYTDSEISRVNRAIDSVSAATSKISKDASRLEREDMELQKQISNIIQNFITNSELEAVADQVADKVYQELEARLKYFAPKADVGQLRSRIKSMQGAGE